MKTYVITGATSGIGYAVTKLLAATGAMVIGTGRSTERCAQAEQQLRSLSGNPGVFYQVADLAQQNEVRTLALNIRKLIEKNNGHSIDGLVNNAGTFTYWFSLTQDGVETQWAVNHFAPFLLTNELLPLLEASGNGRVITVSSESHYGARIDWDDVQHCRNYSGLRAYGETKLANILFTSELNSRAANRSAVRAFAVDPGLVNTDIGKKGTPSIARMVWDLRRRGGTNPEKPAAGIVYLLLDPSLGEAREIYWKDCQPKKASRHARNAELAGKLWEYSQMICGMSERK